MSEPITDILDRLATSSGNLWVCQIEEVLRRASRRIKELEKLEERNEPSPDVAPLPEGNW